MAKQLIKSTRIHVYGGSEFEKRAYSLIGFNIHYNDSVVTLIRGKEKEIPSLLKQFGVFTTEDIKQIQALKNKEMYWADGNSLIIRIA